MDDKGGFIMARIKQNRILFTFPSTSQALYMEQCCKAAKAEGRLIPVPGEISAGCGMAWAVEPKKRRVIEKIVLEKKIIIEGIYDIEL